MSRFFMTFVGNFKSVEVLKFFFSNGMNQYFFARTAPRTVRIENFKRYFCKVAERKVETVEFWKPLKTEKYDAPRYEVSNLGQIRFTKTKKEKQLGVVSDSLSL